MLDKIFRLTDVYCTIALFSIINSTTVKHNSKTIIFDKLNQYIKYINKMSETLLYSFPMIGYEYCICKKSSPILLSVLSNCKVNFSDK